MESPGAGVEDASKTLETVRRFPMLGCRGIVNRPTQNWERRFPFYPRMKLHKIPAQIAEPITPDELQAMACMSR